MRIVAGSSAGGASPCRRTRHAPDERPRARGAVLDARAARRRARARCVRRAPGRSGSRRSRAGRRARCSSSGPPRGRRRAGEHRRSGPVRGTGSGRPAPLASGDPHSTRRGDAYDLVFLDPPYRQPPASGRSSPRCSRRCWPGARVVTESDRRAPLELPLPVDTRPPLRRHPDPHPPGMTNTATSPSVPAPTTRSRAGTSTSSRARRRSTTRSSSPSSTTPCARARRCSAPRSGCELIEDAVGIAAERSRAGLRDARSSTSRARSARARSSRDCARSRTSSTRRR